MGGWVLGWAFVMFAVFAAFVVLAIGFIPAVLAGFVAAAAPSVANSMAWSHEPLS